MRRRPSVCGRGAVPSSSRKSSNPWTRSTGPGPQGPGGGQFRVQPVGCTLGPGCGCLGLPLLALAGVVVSAVIALLWVLSLGRVPASLLRSAKQARRGFTPRLSRPAQPCA